jgi:hypothetical protein
MALRAKMYQHAAEFFDEHGGTAKPIGSVRWQAARPGARKPDPASQRRA